MYACPEMKTCGIFMPCLASAPERYFSTLKSTFFCHTEGVKYEKQAIPYAHVFTDDKDSGVRSLTCEPKCILEG
jgi:hypothetical protein